MDDIANDIDGDYYIAGQQGEIEEVKEHRKVLILEKDREVFKLGSKVDVDVVGNVNAIVRTIKLNYWYLVHGPIDDENRVTPAVARKIAFLRVHALAKGLGDPTRNIGAHNVRYSDIVIVDDDFTIDYTDTTGDQEQDPLEDVPDWAADKAWRAIVKKEVTNMVCLVAFFMRTRGHHWTEETDDRYKAIWRRCLYDTDTPEIDWKYVAHHTYHFIYPDTLDNFWELAVENSTCAGAMTKRFNSLCAGVAAIGAVAVGADDLVIVLPKIRNVIPEAFEELDRCRDVIQNDRWAGSINRRYYNGANLVPDEKRLGSLAAVIIGALASSASAAPLRNSLALKRVADNAPITGALINTMITKAAQDDRMVNGLFAEVDNEG